MPFLQDLREVTVPVEIKRGSVVFTLDAALEKFTPEEGEYHRLRLEAVEIRFHLEGLRQQLDAVISSVVSIADFNLIRPYLESQHLEAERAKLNENKEVVGKARTAEFKKLPAKAAQMVTDADVEAEFERRVQEQTVKADAIREQIDGNEEKGIVGAAQKEHLNLAARLAYLVVGSDITDADSKPILSGAVDKTPEQFEADTQFFYKNFSVNLLVHMHNKVEEAIHGPLETASSSDS